MNLIFINNLNKNTVRGNTKAFCPTNLIKIKDIKTNDGILIKLPEKNLSQALKIAYKIMSDEQFKINNFIDLRVLNHIIILK